MFDYRTPQPIHQFIAAALAEDATGGDHSSLAVIPTGAVQKARMLVKDAGILAGVELARQIFLYVDPQAEVDVLIPDGTAVQYGDVALTVRARTQAILLAERLALNCVQRMSGIATLTARYVEAIAGTGCTLLDTRKTTPNFRMCEKWAVTIGGGSNHRYGLFDMIMLKDNHIDYAGGITKAVALAVQYLKDNNLHMGIEVETRNLTEVAEALAAPGVTRIMFDNMAPPLLREAVTLVNGAVETEASGGITLATIREVAETGVNYISTGAITYAAKPLDLSLKALLTT